MDTKIEFRVIEWSTWQTSAFEQGLNHAAENGGHIVSAGQNDKTWWAIVRYETEQ